MQWKTIKVVALHGVASMEFEIKAVEIVNKKVPLAVVCTRQRLVSDSYSVKQLTLAEDLEKRHSYIAASENTLKPVSKLSAILLIKIHNTCHLRHSAWSLH